MGNPLWLVLRADTWNLVWSPQPQPIHIQFFNASDLANEIPKVMKEIVI